MLKLSARSITAVARATPSLRVLPKARIEREESEPAEYLRLGVGVANRSAPVVEALERRTLLSGLATTTTFSGADGSNPSSSLLLSGGLLYGATAAGGANGVGEVFSLPLTGGTPTVLASFNGSNGSAPTGDLTLIGNTLYGTTDTGGASNGGVVFSLPITGGTPTVLASLSPATGQLHPVGALVLSGNTLIGATTDGGAATEGDVYSLPLAGGAVTELGVFTGSNGIQPVGGLVLSGNTLFGTTIDGGANGVGEVFSLPVTGGTPTVLASFNIIDGQNPVGTLLRSGNTLFGVTFGGGAADAGEVFSLPITGGTPTVLGSFDGTLASVPNSTLALSNGTLFGTTNAGGALGHGNLFSLPIGGGSPTLLASLDNPSASLTTDVGAGVTIDSAGNIFGVSFGGGDGNGDGTVYELPAAVPVVPPATIGGLDPTFGTGGIASHNVGLTSTAGEVVQSDGKTVIAGPAGVAGSQVFGVTRYNADGTLDLSFGGTGVVNASFGGDDVPSAVALLPNGDILLAGTDTTHVNGVTGSRFALAAFTPAGLLDTTFGGSGTGEVLTSFSTTGALTNDVAKAAAVTTSGTIYVAGKSDAGATGTDFAIAAYNADGTPAGGFNGSGRELLDFAGGNDSANALTVQSNGQIVVAGAAQNPSTGVTSIGLARLQSNGALDGSFGTGGKLVTTLRGVDDEATSVALATKETIVVGGVSCTGSFAAGTLAADFAVLRYTSTGKPDKTFNHKGFIITTFGQNSAVTKILAQSDGTIIASGKTEAGFSGASLGVAVARYTTKGTLDPTFNGGKTLITLTAPATPNLVRASVGTSQIRPFDTVDTLRQQFEAFLSNAQGTIAATPGGNLAIAGNTEGFTQVGQLVAIGIDLATSLLAKLPASLKAGASVSITISVKEAGTTTTGSVVTVALFLSPGGGAGDITLFSKPQLLKLKPRQAKSFKIKIKIPTLTAGNYQFIAEADTGATRDLNRLNNITAKAFAIAP